MKILVPTDFSDNANNALSFAKHMAKSQGNTQITLLFAFYAVYDFASSAAQIVDSIESDSKKTMEKTVKLASEEGLKIDYQIVQGTVATAVTSKAFREDYDLIIMGTQGASGIQKTLFGSNTGNVIKESQVPVIAVPSKAKYENISRMIIGAELDHSENKFYHKLIRITENMGLRFEFIHVDTEKNKKNEPNFETLEIFLSQNWPNLKYIAEVVRGDTVISEIEHKTKDIEDAMLVMFYKKKTYFEYLFDKSDSVKMSYHTHLPLLVVK